MIQKSYVFIQIWNISLSNLQFNQLFAFQEIVGPIKTSLQQAYNHTLGLSHNINNSLGMLESLQKHSDRGQNRLSDEIAAGNFKRLHCCTHKN